jgi:hypothetical protein
MADPLCPVDRILHPSDHWSASPTIRSEWKGMQMNRTMFSPRSSTSGSARQREIEEIVEQLIAKRGYHSVIYELLIALHNLAEMSSSDPPNQKTRKRSRCGRERYRLQLIDTAKNVRLSNALARQTPFGRGEWVSGWTERTSIRSDPHDQS